MKFNASHDYRPLNKLQKQKSHDLLYERDESEHLHIRLEPFLKSTFFLNKKNFFQINKINDYIYTVYSVI